MVILDVGCGDKPTGDVNSDLFHYVKCNNFILADAHHLPFKSNTFDKIHAKHCLEHFENPRNFFKEAKRVLKTGGNLECVYPTDSMYVKITIHNLLNLRWSSAFNWKSIILGTKKINYGGHKWQFSDTGLRTMLNDVGFTKIIFYKISFPTLRVDLDSRKNKKKTIINKYLPPWQLDTRFVAQISEN